VDASVACGFEQPRMLYPSTVTSVLHDGDVGALILKRFTLTEIFDAAWLMDACEIRGIELK